MWPYSKFVLNISQKCTGPLLKDKESA